MIRPLLASLALAATLLPGLAGAKTEPEPEPKPAASAPKAATGASNQRPASTTPPNTAPYSPAQAEKPDTSKPVSKSARQDARTVRNAALAECKSQTERQARRDCEQAARNAYNKAITP